MLETLPDFGAILPAAYENLKAVLGTDSPLDMGIRIAGAYLVAVWLASVIWTVRDITDRTGNLFIQTFSVLLVVIFTPILGLPLYLLIRPRTTLAERYYEEAGLHESEYVSECPRCHTEVGEDYRFCPHCGEELLDECAACGAPKNKDWKFCASCGSNGKPVAAEEKKSVAKKAPKIEKAKEESKKEESLDEPEKKPAKDSVPEPKVSADRPVVVVTDEIPEAGK